MYTAAPFGANAYRTIGLETGVDATDALGLVVMLYDGSIQAIVRAERALASGRLSDWRPIAGASKAIDIVHDGLAASLDVRVGGALAESLWSLYDYIGRRLVAANVGADRAIYVEVRGLLAELRDSWVSLRRARQDADLAHAPHRAAVDTLQASGRSLAA